MNDLRRGAVLSLIALCQVFVAGANAENSGSLTQSTLRYLDNSDGRDWPGYGRTFAEQHYSPLVQIDQGNVGRIGLAWSLDLEPLKNSATQPVAVDGVLYFATGLSVVSAVDAASGKLLWRYDPHSAEKAGLNLRLGWGTKGIAWWNGKIYTGTQDGRLLAIDARNGHLVWSAQTLEPNAAAHINSAPRVFAGRVIVGFASDTGKNRGYVTAYDAETGRKLWRFYTVPGNPADGFENEAMAMAAKTWAGEWWKYGGGGAVWGAMAYDAESDLVFIGTGGGYPGDRRIRSADQGDNLFLSSIVALDGKTGAYNWHYQEAPGDTWDYDAIADIELADLNIDGRARKVVMQAPKNGFYYVLDRLTGERISAQPMVKVTWATHIDPKTGRPVETLGARYPDGKTALIWPLGVGTHTWMPMAFSPKTHLTYIPIIESTGPDRLSDRGVDTKNWLAPTDHTFVAAIDGFGYAPHEPEPTDEKQGTSTQAEEKITGALLAWDPVTQKTAWKVSHPTMYNGGVLATAAGLVFQGTIDGTFKAYAADTGRLLWSFVAEAPIVAAPITYTVRGQQYVTVLTGLGMGLTTAAGGGGNTDKYRLDARSQARRVLTFKLDGKAVLPTKVEPLPIIADPQFKEDAASAQAGAATFGHYCGACHGSPGAAVIQAPDLARSSIPLSPEAFKTVVHDGALVPRGMPQFGELRDEQLADLRQFIRAETQKLRRSPGVH